MKDVTNLFAHEATLAPGAVTATTNTTATEVGNAISLSHILSLGASGDTLSAATYFTVRVQESDDGTTWADAANEDVITRVGNEHAQVSNNVTLNDATDVEKVLSLGYIGHKAYTRVTIIAAGTHANGTPMSCVVMRGTHIQPGK